MQRHRGQRTEREGDDTRNILEGEAGKGHSPGNESSPCPNGIGAVTGTIGAITVAFKLHKHALLGGAWISTGAIAVIAEDVIVFLALFGLWRWGSRAIFRTVSQRVTAARCAAAVLHGLALYTLAIVMLLFIGAEHMYFWSTRSLLDGDALLVARKSLGPILFIAINVEGRRFLAWGLLVATVASAASAVSRATCNRFRRTSSRGSRVSTRPETRRGRSSGATSWIEAGILVAQSLRAVVANSGQALAVAYAACILVACLVFGFGKQDGNQRMKLLRRNCFVGVALDVMNTPPSGGGEVWVSAALEAWSERIAGGIVAGAGTSTDRVEFESEPRSKAKWGAGFQTDKGEMRIHGVGAEGDEADPAGRPNVLIVVLESTSGAFVTPSNNAGVSPWAEKLAQRGVSSGSFYSSMPNTNKAMFQIMCGMTPSLETSWVEFERPDLLEAVCLPGLLRSKLGYESLFLTASMVGGLGSLGFDEAIGFAGEGEQGGGEGFRSRSVHDKFSFGHGTFEKVNYLGYDDHVVLNRSLSFLLGQTGGGKSFREKSGGGGRWGGDDSGGKLLTILTVGPHHHHDVPTDFPPDDIAPWTKASALVQGQSSATSFLLDKYLAALRYQDLFLECLYGQLDREGLSDNTYVVVVGDHGEAFGEHGFDKHGNNIYQEGIKVPFFMTGPEGSRIARGDISDRVGMHADIAPTVLDLLGLWRPVSSGLLDDTAAGAGAAASEGFGGSPDQSHPAKAILDQSQMLRGQVGQQAPRIAVEYRGAVVTEGARPGSGLLGESLLGLDERGCAVAGVHYGSKTLAVVVGHWKGVFLYRWEREGNDKRATVVNAQLYDLVTDPREQENLLKEGAGGCCSIMDLHNGPISPKLGRSRLSTSCRAAAEIFVPENVSRRKESSPAEIPLRDACCHLQNAAVAFAGSNLRFYGRKSRNVAS